jgi:hypothetical protein
MSYDQDFFENTSWRVKSRFEKLTDPQNEQLFSYWYFLRI